MYHGNFSSSKVHRESYSLKRCRIGQSGGSPPIWCQRLGCQEICGHLCLKSILQSNWLIEFPRFYSWVILTNYTNDINIG